MSRRMEVGLRTLVLAIHEEATITAAAKGLTGALAQLAALRETASLASGQAGRAVGEEEVMRIVLNARRVRQTRAEAQATTAGALTKAATKAAVATAKAGTAQEASDNPVPVRVRRRLAPLAVRSLTRNLPAIVR
ncbi:hypothetical protein [Azospirillum soli]|uniref:hypothetical protein n=1 Tax=Azospirillum soli TaxID=1304799 RepID=UPI001AE5EE91|nr:hypothetical protein [Azospirillum soli]MBP2311230.1 hypothetical protein [Azospirillum soli]